MPARPASFIRFIEALRSSRRDLEMARVLGENDNVVRVMSVHKSKGLEFPVVIVAGLGRPFNLADSKAPMVLHKELGIGSRYVNLTTRRRSESIAAVAIKERLRLESPGGRDAHTLCSHDPGSGSPVYGRHRQ